MSLPTVQKTDDWLGFPPSPLSGQAHLRHSLASTQVASLPPQLRGSVKLISKHFVISMLSYCLSITLG